MQSPNNIFNTTTKNNLKTTTPNKNNLTRKATAAVPQPRSHGSTTQACAACKYQRRKCASDCILAPYFPHDRQPQFLNAHRLFGVSNIVKIVANLKQPEKDHAMRTIIFQSDARAADPVGGCYRIIHDLEQQINLAKAELEIVLHHLALCRAAAQQQAPPPLDGADSYDERWREQYTTEEEVVAVEDLNSWGCMTGDVHAHAESTSSSFPHDHHHVRKCSLEECNDMIRPIFDHLVCDDVRDDEFEFDSDGNIIPRNITISAEEKAAIKEDDECFSYVQDHHDLKAAATFFSLTNCDL